MAGDETRVQGKLVSWASVIFKINGVRYAGITAISWEQSRERTLGYGQGRSGLPRGATNGKYVPGPVKVKMAEDTAIKIRDDLAALADDGVSYGDVEVPMTLQVVEGTVTNTVEFLRCAVQKEAPSFEESAEQSQEEWEFFDQGIITNKKTLFSSSGS